VPNCKFFLVTEAERKNVRRRARFQQHRDASCHQVFFLPCKVRRRRKFTPFSPRSSIHFLARCPNFCKPLKKIRSLSVQPGFRGSNDLCVGRKMATFQLFFQSRGQVVVRRGQIRRIGWVIKTLEAQVGQFLMGCKCPMSRGIFMQEQDPLVNFPRRFSFKMSFNCTSRDE